jgi:hypothetical protein
MVEKITKGKMIIKESVLDRAKKLLEVDPTDGYFLVSGDINVIKRKELFQISRYTTGFKDTWYEFILYINQFPDEKTFLEKISEISNYMSGRIVCRAFSCNFSVVQTKLRKGRITLRACR